MKFWLPLLLIGIGYNNCRYDTCRCSNDSTCRSNYRGFGLVFVDAQDTACVENKCNPDCTCVLDDETDNVTCAVDFGKWGWVPPDDSEADVWRNMDQEYEINYGAIKSTGMRGANRVTGIGRGIGKIIQITNDTLDGQVYFEMHPDQLGENLGRNRVSLVVELYGGVEFGLEDCDKEGIMLGHRLVDMTGYDDVVANFDYKVERFDDYNSVMESQSIECHPRSTNGRLASLDFSLKDPFYYREESASIMNIWYPFRSTVDFGSLEFCVRLELIDPDYQSEDDDFTDDYFKKRNVNSYMDTKFKVEVSAPSAANGYTRFQDGMSEVKIYSNKPFGPTEDSTTYLPLRYNITGRPTQSPTLAPTTATEIIVPITAYMCSAPDESDVPGAYDYDRTYRLGQTFRMCVGPTKPYEEDYRVIGFQSIVCENSIRNTTIVDQFGVPDEYTWIDRQTIGFTKKEGGIVTSNRTLSISSIITEDLAGAFPEGESFFVCRGIVYLESYVEQDANEGAEDDSGRRIRRRIEAGQSHNIRKPSDSIDSRYLQAEDWENKDLQSWDKISSNPNLPIVGTLSIRFDLTTGSGGEGKVSSFVNKSMNKVKQWFTSSASRQSVRTKSFVAAFLGSTVLLPFWVFS